VLRRVIIVLALCAPLGAACSNSNRGYSGDTEGAFMTSCTVNQGQPVPVCKCTYDEITRQIPFDRYVELDKQLQADPNKVPDELIRVVSDCASRVNSTSTSPSSSSS
jgi:predicted small secreted protein